MGKVLNFEAAQCAREPSYIAMADAVGASKALLDHFLGNAPLSADEAAAAVEKLRRAIPETERSAC